MNGDETSYGVLSADGRWRLHQPAPYFGIVSDPLLFDLELDPTATQPVLPSPPLQLAQMIGSYQAWYTAVHTVDTAYIAHANGSGTLTGMGFLRTPGFGTYTFGIGIPDAHQGQIAAQPGMWSMGRSGNTLAAQYGDAILSGDVQNGNDCHAIVVTGSFDRRLANTAPPDKISLALYIDGVQVDTASVDGFLPVDDPTVETVVGDPLAAPAGVVLAPPVILNTTLGESTPLTVAAFSQTLCNGS